MGIRAAHVLNGIEYLPYGKVTLENLDEYAEWYQKLTLIQQMYWISIIEQQIGLDVLLAIRGSKVYGKVEQILGDYELIYEELGFYGYTVKIRYGETKSEFNTKVLIKWVIYPVVDCDLEEIKNLVEHILIREGINKPIEEIEYHVNDDVDILFLLKHLLIVGSTPGYYENYVWDREREGVYYENKFVPLSPRNAFIEVHLNHLI